MRTPLDPETPDGRLVKLLRDEGNIMAFEMMMKRYQQPIFGFILRQVGDRAKAEDLFQETFLRIYNRIDSCKKPDSLKPWAFAIASNICRNETRRQQVRRGEQVREQMNGHAGAGPDPEGSAMAAETRRKIEHALQELPDAQREVFILYHYTRLSYDEIAEALEVPIGTVKSRMNAALTRLRDLLAELRKGD
jgi:RNA polymerase sigma-70 factor (ECF subfamily)